MRTAAHFGPECPRFPMKKPVRQSAKKYVETSLRVENAISKENVEKERTLKKLLMDNQKMKNQIQRNRLKSRKVRQRVALREEFIEFLNKQDDD